MRRRGADAAADPRAPRAQTFEPDAAIACEPVAAASFESLSRTWEKGLKWRLVQRPGGAFIQPDDWYRMYAAVQQARGGRMRRERASFRDALPPCLLVFRAH
jgi:hypothetical protein